MRLIDIETINWYDDLFMKGVNHSGVWVRYRDVENLIRNAPTVDAEPVRHGKWDDTGVAFYRKCTACGCFGDGEYNYCPNCGAKMDGVKNGRV